MNMTEAWELVLKAAESRKFIDDLDFKKEGVRAYPKLEQALKKVTPRITRMRTRLDYQRSQKAGKPQCPKWAAP